MDFIKVIDIHSESGEEEVEITPTPYCGYIGQLEYRTQEGWLLNWHHEDWYEDSPIYNEHLGSSRVFTDFCGTREEAIAEGVLLLTRFLIEGLEQLGADDQMTLVDLKQEY